jgi:hypothetical protein
MTRLASTLTGESGVQFPNVRGPLPTVAQPESIAAEPAMNTRRSMSRNIDRA